MQMHNALLRDLALLIVPTPANLSARKVKYSPATLVLVFIYFVLVPLRRACGSLSVQRALESSWLVMLDQLLGEGRSWCLGRWWSLDSRQSPIPS